MIFNGSSILLTYAISKVSLFGVNNLDTANTVTVSSIIASIPVALIGLILSIFLLVAIAYLNGRLGYIKHGFRKISDRPGQRNVLQTSLSGLHLLFVFSFRS